MSPRRGALLAGALALALLPAGLRAGNLLLLAGVLALGAWRLRATGESGEEGPPPRWLEAAGLLAAVAALLAGALPLVAWDEPLGTDWFRYLGNAVAVAEGDWESYHLWRGPVHPWLCAKVAPWAGGLVIAAHAVALAAVAALLPLTWWLGRMALGPWPALWAVLLLAGWPDLQLLAHAATPYPLLAALVLLGAALCAASLRHHPSWALAGGIALGLAVGTDLRAQALGAGVVLALLGAAAVERSLRRRALVAALLAAVGAAGVGALILGLLPVDLVPLSEQVALQRGLHAAEGPASCAAGASLACTRDTLAHNLWRAQLQVPVGLPALGLLAALGLLPAPGRPRWGPLLLALPLLPSLPAIALVGVMHRYALPLAPLAVLLVGAGLHRLGGVVPSPRPWARPAVAGAAVLLVAGAWLTWRGTLVSRATGRWTRPEAAPSVDIREPTRLTRMARALGEAGPEDRIVDCAKAGLHVRLYPRPVVDWGAPGGRTTRRCTELVQGGPTTRGTTWLLTPPGPAPSSAWEQVTVHAGPRLVLLRGER